MKKFIQSRFWQILGGIFGGIAGYFYWREIGCVTGTCPITSKPLNSIIYFAVLAYFVTGTIEGFRAQRIKKSREW
jgi:tetrahydromethanopterin S-methyltransferase subunit D